MLGWLYKMLGYHVCEAFTNWEDRLAVFTRVATGTEFAVTGIKKVQSVRRWQERR